MLSPIRGDVVLSPGLRFLRGTPPLDLDVKEISPDKKSGKMVGCGIAKSDTNGLVGLWPMISSY